MRAGIAALIYLAAMALPVVRPADGLGLYIALAAVRPQNITYGIDLAGGRFSIVCLFFVMVGWMIRVPRLKPRWGPMHALLLLFFADLVLCYVTAMDLVAARYVFDMMYVPIVVSLVATQILRREDDLYRALWWLGGGLGFLGYWAAYSYHLTNYYQVYWDGEIMGPGGHIVDRNDLGLALNVAIPILFFMVFMAKRWWSKAVAFVSMAPCALIVLETGSRGAFLGLAAVGSFILYKMHHKRWIFGLAIVAVAGGLYAVPPEYIERIAGISGAAESDSSAAGRVEAWGMAIEMARQHPLNGVGLGCFTVWRREVLGDPDPLVAHNGFFQLLGTTGIPGALLWLLLVGRLWQLAARNERRLKRAKMKGTRLWHMVLAIKASLIAYVVCTMFLSQEDFEFFYYVIGIMSALHLHISEVLKRKTAEEAEEVQAGAVEEALLEPGPEPLPGNAYPTAPPWSSAGRG